MMFLSGHNGPNKIPYHGAQIAKAGRTIAGAPQTTSPMIHRPTMHGGKILHQCPRSQQSLAMCQVQSCDSQYTEINIAVAIKPTTINSITKSGCS